MAKHKATPAEWKDIKRMAENRMTLASCIFDLYTTINKLKERIKILENQKSTVDFIPASKETLSDDEIFQIASKTFGHEKIDMCSLDLFVDGVELLDFANAVMNKK
jgi:hypothetical protein